MITESIPQFTRELKKIKDNEAKISILVKLEMVEKVGIYQMQATNDASYIKRYDLYEIRAGHKSRNYRILCFVKNNCCWFLHLFFKKTQQIELREFNTAFSRKKLI